MTETDFFEQLRDFGDEAVPKIIEQWRMIIEGGGKTAVTVKCTACGHPVTAQVPVVDARGLRDIVAELRLVAAEKAKQAKEETEGKRASAVLRDLESATSEEIAQRIADLEEQLGAGTAQG